MNLPGESSRMYATRRPKDRRGAHSEQIQYFLAAFLGRADDLTEAARSTPILRILGGALLGWSLLELITMLTNSKRRALHDWIAGTVVVREAGAAEPISNSESASFEPASDRL